MAGEWEGGFSGSQGSCQICLARAGPLWLLPCQKAYSKTDRKGQLCKKRALGLRRCYQLVHRPRNLCHLMPFPEPKLWVFRTDWAF